MGFIDTKQVLKHLKDHLYLYLILSLVIISNYNILLGLIEDWSTDDNFSHGFLVIPISIYIFYRQRDKLSFPTSVYTPGLALVIIGCLGLILGVAAKEFFTTRVSLVLIITGCSLYYLGRENFSKVWFSFFFLLFMIPIPAIIYYATTLPMQLFASKVTVFLLKVVGVPVARDGNIIMLPEFTLEVAEACSGLRSLVTLMALGAFYGYLTLPGRLLPTTLFVATIPIAIVTNIVRVFVTAIGAYAISRKLAEDFLHEISGVVVFLTAMTLMFILGSLLKWARRIFISS